MTGTQFGRYVFLVETVSNTAVSLTASVDAEDLAAASVTVPATGTAGQDVAVTYTADNLSDLAVTQDWYDSLYLTQGATLDSSAILLDRVYITSPVAAHGSYTETLDVPLPGVLPGNYHVILFVQQPRPGARRQPQQQSAPQRDGFRNH